MAPTLVGSGAPAVVQAHDRGHERHTVIPSTLYPPRAADKTSESSGLAFDREAVAAALGGVDLSSCKTTKGPTVSGHVTLTFGTDGTPASVDVDSEPFKGTPVGDCIRQRYLSVKVPPFGGSAPIRVGKSFTL